MITKKILIYLGVTILALIMAYFIWMAVLMIGTITPFKGFSLTVLLILFILLFAIILFFSIVLRERNRTKVLLYLIGAVIVFFLICFFVSDWVLQNQVNDLKKSFEKMGYPLDIETLGVVPEDSNAAPVYERAIDLLKDSEPIAFLDVLHETIGNIQLSREDFKILEKWVRDNQTVMEKLKDIEKYPKFRYREYAEYQYRLYALPLMKLIKIRKLAELLIANVIVDIRYENPKMAQSSFEKLAHLVNSLRQEYSLIYSLIAMRITIETFSLCGYELLHSKEPIISFAMIDDLADSSFISKGLYGEALYIYYFHGKPTAAPVLYFGLDHFVKTFKREYLTVLRDVLKLLRENTFYPDEQIKRLKTSIKNLPEFPYGIFSFPNFERFLQAEYEYKTTISLLHILLALTISKKHTGAFPENLQMLVNDGLIKVIPNDVLSGKPFIYRKEKDKVIVYSVGANMCDDGGDFKNNKDIGYLLLF